MKLFNTIQELWDYCEYCPICTRKSRKLTISVGPDMSVKLIDYKKQNNNLLLQCTHKQKDQVYNIDYNINCTDNTFQIGEPKLVQLGSNPISNTEQIINAYFYFFIEGVCGECDNTTASSVDLEFDDGTISNIELERENFYLFETEEKYHLTIVHDQEQILVSRLQSEGMGYITNSKPIVLPMFKLDFTDQAKTIKKIKTLILFS